MTSPNELSELPPIETTIEAPEGDEREPGSIVQVVLHAAVTEVGTLELSAEETDSGRRHRLTFDVRAAG